VLAAQVQSSTLSSNVTSLQAQTTALTSNLTAVNANINSLSANVSSLQAGSGGTPDSAALADLLSRARGISLTGNLTFQEVPVGALNFQDFTIRNKGFDRLVVSGIQFPSGFSGDWTSGTIAPLSVQNVTVSFSPVSASAYGGNITVDSDATEGVAFITIAGTGIMPVAGWVTTLAGSGNAGHAEGMGTAASFNSPYGVAVDSSGNVYVADTNNQRIRKITPNGTVTTLAGSGNESYADGIGTAASFYSPSGVAVDSSGNVYVADSYNHRIRKILGPQQ
jgi:hypothetical protein